MWKMEIPKSEIFNLFTKKIDSRSHKLNKEFGLRLEKRQNMYLMGEWDTSMEAKVA